MGIFFFFIYPSFTALNRPTRRKAAMTMMKLRSVFKNCGVRMSVPLFFEKYRPVTNRAVLNGVSIPDQLKSRAVSSDLPLR